MEVRSGSFILYFLAILFLGQIQPAVAQDCKMDETKLEPVIDKYNPFFTDHTWENESKTETARLDPWRLVMIRQKGCIRHHILVTLMLDASQIESSDKFWVGEGVVLMKRIFFGDKDFPLYRRQFEEQFVKSYVEAGINEVFNFPIGERTFIGKVEVGEWGGKIRLEIVRFIISEKIRMPGIERGADDGWFRGG